MPCWVDTDQPDPVAAAQFYSGLFGWETEDTMPDEADGHYFMARLSGRDAAAISSMHEGGPPFAVWNTYVRVDSADATAEKVRAAGGEVLSEPFDVFDAGRMAVCADTEGAVFCLWEPGRHRGAAAVNEHGAVVFNVLHTDDLDAARAFYGAVFGWDTIDVDGSMWVLDGYGDNQEVLNPGMRDAMAAMGAPARFEDVVASLAPRGGGPACWNMMFAVDDTDAAVARSVELGGTIVSPPETVPWQRVAVLTDPAGATFAVSQFIPPGA